MTVRRCLLCDVVLRPDEGLFELTAGAAALWRQSFGREPAPASEVDGVCDPCRNLPDAERKRRAHEAKEKILRDIAKDIESI